jgi:hypothetical protein
VKVVIWPDQSNTLNRYCGAAGTSMASPIVAGAVALLLEADPALTPEEVRLALQETAITDEHTGPLASPDNLWGAGKLNAYAAMQHVLGITPGEAPGALRDARSVCTILLRPFGLALTIPETAEPRDVVVEVFDLRGRLAAAGRLDNTASFGGFSRPAGGVYTVVVRGARRQVILTRTAVAVR